MKKSLFLLMVSVTGVLLSNSCTKESTSKDNGMIQLTITAGLPDTKTVFSEQSGENPLTVNWKSGTTELFGIFVGTSSQVPNQFTANVTSDSKSAAFTGSIPSATANGTNLIAVYISTLLLILLLYHSIFRRRLAMEIISLNLQRSFQW